MRIDAIRHERNAYLFFCSTYCRDKFVRGGETIDEEDEIWDAVEEGTWMNDDDYDSGCVNKQEWRWADTPYWRRDASLRRIELYASPSY